VTDAAAGPWSACGFASRVGRAVSGLLSRLLSDVYLRWALAFVLLALVLRIIWVVTVNPYPLDGRFDDTQFYDSSAKALAEGRGYLNFEEKPTARWPIGYSGLIAPSTSSLRQRAGP
jgi:uncharacterized membrane protein YfcA